MWQAQVGDLKTANVITMAPLVVKDKVIVGVAGSDFATRGYVDAYDTRTGARVWRFYTIPLEDSPADIPGRATTSPCAAAAACG